MADPRLTQSMNSSGSSVEESSTKLVVFVSRALTYDTEPGLVNSLREENVSIKQATRDRGHYPKFESVPQA